MDTQQRIQYITRNTQEIVTEEELKKLLEEKKEPVVYLGTAITGKPHIAYFLWVLKLADFIKAGFKVKLLLADVHGALDNCPWDLLEKRYAYYERVINLMFECVGAEVSQVEIVKGSSFQFDKNYLYDMLRISTLASVRDCTKAASDVVKFGDNPKLSGLIYPILQALDEQYLDVDVQYGGLDQRKILMFAREYLPKIGHRPRIEIMTPMIPGLIGKKMSASDPRSKVDLLDDEGTVNKKIRGAYCEEGIVADNGVLAFLKHVIMVLKEDKNVSFVVERPEKFGGNLTFSTYADVEESYVAKQLHPLDLKMALAKEINSLLVPLQKHRAELEKLAKEAYET